MLSYNQIVEAIEAEGHALGGLVDRIARAYDAEADAAIKWKAARARLRISLREEHKGERLPADWYEDKAMELAAPEFASHVRTINDLALLREERNIRTSRLDALRTLAAGMRAAGG